MSTGKWQTFDLKQNLGQLAKVRTQTYVGWMHRAIQFLDAQSKILKDIRMGNGYGEWSDYDLNANEMIVGIFGETYDQSYDKKMKSFGFVLLQK